MAASKKSAAQKPIKIAKLKEGSLHTALGVPQGEPIPAAKLAAAAKSKDPGLRKKAQFAINAKGFHHTGSKKKGK
ncbi:MAG TPA: hypothetical protein VGG83_10770 [Trebonia sp.]|jgi:hypothetical protein